MEREEREERMCVAHKEDAPSAKHVLQVCACKEF